MHLIKTKVITGKASQNQYMYLITVLYVFVKFTIKGSFLSAMFYYFCFLEFFSRLCYVSVYCYLQFSDTEPIYSHNQSVISV